jgi:RNA polymerase sigma-70 factor (ECF subfamily)
MDMPWPEPECDDAVVRQVLAGDVARFEVLVRRYNQRVYRVVRSVLRDDAEAEDVMQHAYVAAFEHLQQFRGDARFSTWLTRIAVYEALRRLRKGRRTVPLDDAEPRVDPSQWDWRDPEAVAIAAELRPVLEAAVESLATGYRTVFVLREVEGLSTLEVATAMALTEDNVKVRLHRAKGMLRERLRHDLGDPALQVWRFEAVRCDRVVARLWQQLAPA